MLLREATEDQVAVMMECLSRFSAVSGLSINLGKSQIFCSPNTDNGVKSRIGDITKIPVSSHLCKYLGFQLSKKGFLKIIFPIS